jgi:hypothetical protein
VRSGGFVSAGIGLCVALALTAAPAPAQTTGEIGGPPTMGGHLPFPPPHKRTFFPKATSEPIVIGLGFNAFGRVEIVGQDSKEGLCIFIDYPNQVSSSARCGPMALSKVIAVESVRWETRRRRSRSLTELSGFMQPSVTTVTAVAHRNKRRKGTRKAVLGIVATPNTDLLARLHQSTPFGFFVADFRGCVAETKVRLHAFDPTGQQLGTTLVNLAFPGRFRPFDPCTPGSSSVGFVATPSGQRPIGLQRSAGSEP